MEEIVPTNAHLANIRLEVCHKTGHLFHRAEYIYARDTQQTAFRGMGREAAAKFTRLFCARCTTVVEIEVCPPLDVREKNDHPNKPPIIQTAAA